MFKRNRAKLLAYFFWILAAFTGIVLFPDLVTSEEKKSAEPITKGQRVFTCGHSFHVFVPDILADIAESRDQRSRSSRNVFDWRLTHHSALGCMEEKNQAKEALKTGKVDVLTLSPIFLPDPGIEKFTNLALEHNKDIRILVQPIWLRWDIYEPTTKRPAKVDHNAITGAELRKRHEPYFKSMDEYIGELNKKLGKTVLYEVPVPQAVIALREKIIAGEVPGIKTQEELFTDALGHGKPPLTLLVSYCNYAVMYRRSPVGLPVPNVLKASKLGENEAKVNRILQELAWEAVSKHPLSGVQRLNGLRRSIHYPELTVFGRRRASRRKLDVDCHHSCANLAPITLRLYGDGPLNQVGLAGKRIVR